MSSDNGINLRRQLKEMFTKPSAFANISAAKKLAAQSKKKRKKKKRKNSSS